ncbi:zinc-finger [Streptoalloteichus tenebrarius]|uniref:Zinc-finger n=1 Tax=Streptoalloteichus tenebrarius (strain ATCC 17920 / DSM 40477 / JCM 4838 / CBS 697.72 / NBRC 16177 / NCIMB 11028 / NRRL B-12390 / A12253. 1 / ISP 5477) TaxID=1933 RepID=A0ABT1HTL7_STRSD|nr:zinc-finger [Streptoalloteichus tenebrarius]
MIPVTWQPHAEQRHAYAGPQVPDGFTVMLLCGLEIEARGGLPKYPHWLWPECPTCRERAGAGSPNQPPSGLVARFDIDLPAYGH